MYWLFSHVSNAITYTGILWVTHNDKYTFQLKLDLEAIHSYYPQNMDANRAYVWVIVWLD